MSKLKDNLIRLGNNNPELRDHIRPVLDRIQEVTRPRTSSFQKTAGFTRYWEVTEAFSEEEWSQILKGARTIIQKTEQKGYDIKGPHGTGSPELTDQYISLNGDASGEWMDDYYKELRENDPEEFESVPDAYKYQDQMHESFVLDRGPHRSFCKTGRKPYDMTVSSILNLAKSVAPSKIDISSDGSTKWDVIKASRMAT